MKLSKIGYYSDFIIYPFCITFLAIVGLPAAGSNGALGWVMIFLGCVAAWTLIEYFLHRFAFHHLPYLRQLHQEHHDEERGLIGTPVWLSLSAHILFVFLPAFFIGNLFTASAMSGGIMLGYLWYVIVHHMTHHWHMAHDTYLYRLKRHHALHHHASENCNFGVTTAIWDRVFNTRLQITR